MPALQRLRAYHALLAVLAIGAYVSGEAGLVHAWLGYGVAAVIALRLALALTGAPQLGLSRFQPKFEGLTASTALTHPAISRTLVAAIAACVLGVTATGVALDQGRALGLAAPPPAGAASSASAGFADRGGDDLEDANEEADRERDESPLGEAHEALAKLLMGLVAAHVVYLLVLKRPLARFMLFLPVPRKG